MTEKKAIKSTPITGDRLKDPEFQKQLIILVKDDLKKIERKEFSRLPYYAPAVEFEKETGVIGIAGKYKMPDEKAHADMEFEHCNKFSKYIYAVNKIGKYADFLPSKVKKKLTVLAKEGQKTGLPKMLKNFDELVKLNPELKKLEVDRANIGKVNDAIFGITSQFNVDDINDFLKRDFFYGETKETKLKDEIEKRTGIDIQWRPSISTLKKIQIQVYKKNKSQTMDIVAIKQQNIR